MYFILWRVHLLRQPPKFIYIPKARLLSAHASIRILILVLNLVLRPHKCIPETPLLFYLGNVFEQHSLSKFHHSIVDLSRNSVGYSIPLWCSLLMHASYYRHEPLKKWKVFSTIQHLTWTSWSNYWDSYCEICKD